MGEIVIEGNPETGTKSRSSRRVPMVPPMKELLEHASTRNESVHLRTHLPGQRNTKSMDRCSRSKNRTDPHHDLRHLFATTCIDSGVDIPTVASWLGHKDGCALAMKVYGHLRNEHSLVVAKKVSFKD